MSIFDEASELKKTLNGTEKFDVKILLLKF